LAWLPLEKFRGDVTGRIMYVAIRCDAESSIDIDHFYMELSDCFCLSPAGESSSLEGYLPILKWHLEKML